MPRIRFTLNGKETVASYEPGMHLLEVLREECGIISAKNGCAPEGACGCCLVMIDGTPALSCLRKPEQTEGREVVTLEGLPEDVRKRMGDAFVLEGGVQCGFCIPGIVVRAASLIEQGKTGDRAAVAKALDGHLCRCTGYGRILDSIQTAGEAAACGDQLHAHRAASAPVLRRAVRADSKPRVFERKRERARDSLTASAIRFRAWAAPSRRSATNSSSTICACLECFTARWC